MLYSFIDNLTFARPDYPQEYYYVNETSDVSLQCRVKSYPAATVTWSVSTPDVRYTFGSDVIENKPEYALVERTWNITNVNRTDAGQYVCSADSGMEKGNITSILVVYCKSKPIIFYGSN